MRGELNGTGREIAALEFKIDDHQRTLGEFAIQTTKAIGEVRTELAMAKGAIISEVSQRMDALSTDHAHMKGRLLGIFAGISVVVSLLGIAASILAR
jgi:hypothetical protein